MQHVIHCALFHHLPIAHNDHFVSNLRHNAKVVGDEQNSGAVAALDIFDQVQNLRLSCYIKSRRWLVRDQKVGFERQCNRNHDTLSLTTRKLVWVRFCHARRVWQIYVFHYFDHTGIAFAHAHIRVDFQHLGNLITNTYNRVERGHWFLENHRHPLAAQFAQHRLWNVQDFVAVQQDRPCGWG